MSVTHSRRRESLTFSRFAAVLAVGEGAALALVAIGLAPGRIRTGLGRLVLVIDAVTVVALFLVGVRLWRAHRLARLMAALVCGSLIVLDARAVPHGDPVEISVVVLN